MTTTWLVTGGAGYIGAHVVRSLVASGRAAVVVDDLSTGLTSRLPAGTELVHGSVVDTPLLTTLLGRIRPAGVIHLAGKKFPSESVADPLLYAHHNVGGVTSLLEAMRATDVDRVVFSSSCSVYGTPEAGLVDESAPTVPESPYGESKLYGERLFAAAASAYGTSVISLRYFNVVGAAEPALADTSPLNLVPLVLRALRTGTPPQVYGGDYPTPDGTCVRDYVHVEDLAEAHVRAAGALETNPSRAGHQAVYNVGRGEGSSVLQVLDAVRAASGSSFAHEVRERRPGDPARVIGRVDAIARDLDWTATRDLTDMVRSAWLADQARATLG